MASASMDSSVRASMDFNGPLNTLSMSPSNKYIAVGGRDVLKIVALEAAGFSEKRNLRVGKSNLNFSTNDIRWNPQSESLLATAATNGAVVIWNLQREGFKHVQERVLSGHRRAVNRICWHPDGNLLISGSQDGTIKLWDKRTGKVTNTYQPKSESVRDVRISPFQPMRFAVAFENGIVQVWDIRKNTQPELKFTAHKGLVLALDWHPTKPSVLASGGRDRYVKIWDLQDVKQPKQTIQTIASVGRVAWRPNCPDHIATSASLMDNSIHVWDVQRPCIPVASMKGHTDVASGIIWLDTPIVSSPASAAASNVLNEGVIECEGHNYWQHMVACSKDGTLKLHSLADSFKPHQSLSSAAMALNSRGQLAFSYDFIDRSCASLQIHRHFNPFSTLFTVSDATELSPNEHKGNSVSGISGSFDSSEHIQQGLQSSTRTFAPGSQTPPLPPRSSTSRLNSTGNLLTLQSGGGTLSSAGNYKSLGNMQTAGGLTRQSSSSASHQNLQSMHSNSVHSGTIMGNSSSSADTSGLDTKRPMLHYVNQSGSAISSTTSPTAISSAVSPAPRALVAIVAMQNISTASQLEKILYGDADEYFRMEQQTAFMKAQFQPVLHLKDTFGFDEEVFRFLAKQYALYSDLSFADACAHNALAAFVTGNSQACQMWRILEVLYEEDRPTEVAAAQVNPRADSGDYQSEPKQRERHDTEDLQDASDYEPNGETTRQRHPRSQPISAARNTTDGSEESDTVSTNTNQTEMLLQQLDHVNPDAMQGFDPYPYNKLGGERDASTSKSGTHIQNNVSSSSPMTVHGNAVHGELSHVRDDVLKELLEYYADLGDLQTCVAIAAVVAKVSDVEKVMSKAWLQQIYMHYIDLLHQLRLYATANDLITKCSDQSIRQMNMKSTSVYLNCARCSKPFESFASNNPKGNDGVPSARCSSCQNLVTRCSICQLPVRGLYVWCPVCSHGGHLEHLTEWFKHEDLCPTGCSHRCSFNFATTCNEADVGA